MSGVQTCALPICADGKAISDTKRYQMLGNSVAVPCVAYIMQGIRDAVGGE